MCNCCAMSLKEAGKAIILSNVNTMAGAQAAILGQEGAWGPTMMYPHYQPRTAICKGGYMKN